MASPPRSASGRSSRPCGPCSSGARSRPEGSRWAWHHRGRLPSGLRASARDGPRPIPRGTWCPYRCAGRRLVDDPVSGSMAKASARRSVSRVLSHDALRRRGDGHPSGAVGCPTAHAADPRAGQRTSSPTDVSADGCALLFGLAPGGVCPFHSDRRLAPTIGIVTVALVLASRRAGVTRHPALRSSDFPHAARRVAPSPTRSHPTASLTDRVYPPQGTNGPDATGDAFPVVTAVSSTTPGSPVSVSSRTTPTPLAYDLCSTRSGSSGVTSFVTRTSV